MSVNFQSDGQLHSSHQAEDNPGVNDAVVVADRPDNQNTLDTPGCLNSRIEMIQSNVLAERVVISELDGQISDSELKHNLRRATYCLDNIEDVFLSSARQDQRTPDALARWLSYAEFQLKMSAGRRAEVQGIVAKRE
jgi:hypothetical protein